MFLHFFIICTRGTLISNVLLINDKQMVIVFTATEQPQKDLFIDNGAGAFSGTEQKKKSKGKGFPSGSTSKIASKSQSTSLVVKTSKSGPAIEIVF